MKYSQTLTMYVIIGLIIACLTPINGFNHTFAQTTDTNATKTITFDTFIIHLDKNGTMTKFDTQKQSINGTNEQLVAKFPDLLKSFYNTTGTDRHAVFLDYQKKDKPITTIENVTAQTYTNEFKSSLSGPNSSTHRCWIIVENVAPDPGQETGNIHVTRCW
jgi:hypothetical protein